MVGKRGYLRMEVLVRIRYCRTGKRRWVSGRAPIHPRLIIYGNVGQPLLIIKGKFI